MYTTDNEKSSTCWKCRLCNTLTPREQVICSNPNCRADLSLQGDIYDPSEPKKAGRDGGDDISTGGSDESGSSSHLWEDDDPGTDKNEKTKRLSRSERKALKKKQAEERAQAAAEQRALYDRGPVKTFCFSVLTILISFLTGALAGGFMLMSFTYWGDLFYFRVGRVSYPNAILWHQIIPGICLIILSLVFARCVLKDRNDRKRLYTAIGFWMFPFVVSCCRGFAHDGGDSYELLSVYLFFLFAVEPVLVGSALAGVKGLKRVSSILRWIGALTLGATGVTAVILAIDTYFIGIL